MLAQRGIVIIQNISNFLQVEQIILIRNQILKVLFNFYWKFQILDIYFLIVISFVLKF